MRDDQITEDLRLYYSWVRSLPVFPTGGRSKAIDLAHIKGLPMTGVAGRTLAEFAPRRTPMSKWLVLPVKREEHDVAYPDSIHAIGEDAWLEKHGLTRAHALGYILHNVLQFQAATRFVDGGKEPE